MRNSSLSNKVMFWQTHKQQLPSESQGSFLLISRGGMRHQSKKMRVILPNIKQLLCTYILVLDINVIKTPRNVDDEPARAAEGRSGWRGGDVSGSF